MSSKYWYVLADSNRYRSLSSPDVNPEDINYLCELFRDGDTIADEWEPPNISLWDETGEQRKPIGYFPAFPGLFVIDKTALELLYPVIEPTLIEVLPLKTDVGDFAVLNIEKVDCIDHSRAQFKFFSSGRIMRVEKFAFDEQNIQGKHLFRLNEESFAKVFADNVFKTTVEENGLVGLAFFALNHI